MTQEQIVFASLKIVVPILRRNPDNYPLWRVLYRLDCRLHELAPERYFAPNPPSSMTLNGMLDLFEKMEDAQLLIQSSLSIVLVR